MKRDGELGFLEISGKEGKSMEQKGVLSRRRFLYLSAAAATGIAVVACQPQTVVVKETVEVEKVVKETVEVEKVVKETVEVEKVVKETVEVEKVVKETVEVEKVSEKQAPMWQDLVATGKLVGLDERLPGEPFIEEVEDRIGIYGGTRYRAVKGPQDMNGASSYTKEHTVTYSKDGKKVVPNVVRGLEILDEGKTFVFTLRKGLRWSDGELFTAEDFMFVYEDALLNKDLYPTLPAWANLGNVPVKVEAPDDYTVRFTFGLPSGTFLMKVSFIWGGIWPYLPKHYLKQFHPNYTEAGDLDKKVTEANFDNWTKLYALKNDFKSTPERPQLRAWVLTDTGPPAICERNPYYFKLDPAGQQLPYIDYDRFDFVEDTEMLTLKAITGEVTYWDRDCSFRDIALYYENADKGDYDVVTQQPSITAGWGADLGINQTMLGDDVMRGILRDRRFRVALNLSIDRDEINDLVYAGQYTGAKDDYPKELRDEDDIWDFYGFDPDRASQLLDEMSLTKGADGFRVRPDGKQLGLKMEVYIQDPAAMDVYEMMVGYWQAIGINASVEELSYDLLWPRIQGSEHHISSDGPGYPFGGLAGIAYDSAFFPITANKGYGPLWGLWYASAGESGEEPPEIIKNLQSIRDQLQVTVDPDEQWKLVLEANRIVNGEVLGVWTVGGGIDVKVVKRGLQNVYEIEPDVLWENYESIGANQFFFDPPQT